MSFSVEDEIIDYSKIAKEFNLDLDIKINVETHLVTVTIKDKVPTSLVNVIRYFAIYAYPTRRMMPVEEDVVNPDTKILIEPVITQIRDMKFAHDCPLSEGRFSITHDKIFSNPILVSASKLKEAKYVNDHSITVLNKGRTLAFSYKIVEQTGVESGLTCHYFASLFNRENIDEIEEKTKHGDMVKFNTGRFSFRYTDNISGSEVFERIKTLAKNVIDEILNNFDTYFTVNLAVPQLLVPNDRSGIVANCICRYVFAEYPERFVSNPVPGKNESICKYTNSTPDEVKDHIIDALKKIKKDLS